MATSESKIIVKLEAEVNKLNTELTKAGKRISAFEQQADKSAKRVSSSFSGLDVALKSAISIAAIRKVGQLADEYTNITNRLKLVTDGTQQLAFAQDAVFGIAQRTRQALGPTAELYQRIAQNADQLGLSLTDVNGVVETISKTLVISGASAQGSQAALIQLGQAFASGTLRGEELNSVLEQAPALARAIADGLGVTIGQLRAMGKEGELSADKVIDALQKQAIAVDDSFGKTTGTIGQAFTKLNNSIIRTIGLMDQATGASGGFARGIDNVANSIDSFSKQNDQVFKLTQQLNTAKQALQGFGSVDVPQARQLKKDIADIEAQIRRLQTLQGQSRAEPLPEGKPLSLAAPSLDFGDGKDLAASIEQAVQAGERYQKQIEDAAEFSRKKIADTVAGYQLEAKTIGMTADQIKLYQLALDGATPAQIALTKSAMDTVAAFEEQQRVFESQIELIERADQLRAESLPAEVRAIEELQGKYRDLAEAVEAGVISQGEAANTAAGLAARWQEGVDKMNEKTDSMSVFAKRAAENMQDAFADFLFDPFADGLDGMLKNFGQILQRMVAEAAAAQIFEAIGGYGKSNSGAGGTIGVIASIASIFGGARAAGGPVDMGKSYLVGERGPEMFVPNAAGRIEPNAGGGSNVFNINVSVPGGANTEQARVAGAAAGRAAVRAIDGARRYS